ncbi:hypothetical protein QS468_24500 [Bacillus subtilis]|nr:hypothetical protein [Pseudomonas sp. A29(2023)]MDL5595900.1 hypothetical protein [Bacillus subtilis]
MKLQHVGILLAALLLSACGESSQTFLLDNPTNAPITLSLDGQTHEIPANTSSELKLAPGAHELRNEKLGEVRFIVYAGGKGALINPTLSDYIIANQIYVTDESKLSSFGQLKNKVALDGVEFIGPFWQSHDLFIANAWNFGPREAFPETMELSHVPTDGGKFYSKLFTAQEFIDYYESEYGASGYFSSQRPDGFVQPPHSLERPSSTLPEMHPEFEAHSGPLRDIYARYLKATDPKEQRQLQKAFGDAMNAFSSATSTVASSKLPMEANQIHSDFVKSVYGAISKTAQVID